MICELTFDTIEGVRTGANFELILLVSGSLDRESSLTFHTMIKGH